MVEWLSEVGGDGGASGGGCEWEVGGVVERRWSGWRRVRWVCEAMVVEWGYVGEWWCCEWAVE